jgi:hypothetical protein
MDIIYASEFSSTQINDARYKEIFFCQNWLLPSVNIIESILVLTHEQKKSFNSCKY